MADIDADDDYDIFISDGFRVYYYCQNYGTLTQPTFATPVPNWQGFNYVNGQYGYYYDIDSDGDLDRFITMDTESQDYNHLGSYRNLGTAQESNFVLEDSTFVHVECGQFHFVELTLKILTMMEMVILF